MRKKTTYPVLSIAGSDCSGGAGIQADIKTISANGCYAMAAITSITAQNTTGVSAVEGVSPEMVARQIDMVYADIPPMAVKTGMLFSDEIVKAVADALRNNKVRNLVVDPVMISTSGCRLISEEAIDIMTRELFPLAEVVTPNKMEAEALTGETKAEVQAEKLFAMGCKAVLVKGGDAETGNVKNDLFCAADGTRFVLSTPAVNTVNTHGTGCTLSSAIASNLAKGMTIADAVKAAKEYIYGAISNGADNIIGHGHGPVDHFWNYKCE